MMFEGRDKTNLFDREVVTANYVERTLALMREAQVYIIFQGGTGTISEFGMAWGLARLYFGHHKPLILYGKFWHKIMHAFEKSMLIRAEESKVYKIVDSPDQVIKAILEFEQQLQTGDHNHKIKGDFNI
jgi:predicted Rossmann-fold nucleotide-binding protein